MKRSRFDVAPKALFRFHATPDALRHLIPPWEKVHVEQPPTSLEVGTKVVLVTQMGPLKVRWVAEHTAYEDRGDLGGTFTDIQLQGPFRRWVHRHSVLPAEDGTACLVDEVEFELPFSPVSRWLFGALARRRIERMFDFRHEATARALGCRRLPE